MRRGSTLPFRLRYADFVAGSFVLLAIVGIFVVALVIVFKQNLFEERFTYKTIFKAGYDIHAGSTVKIAGIEAGLVQEVMLTPNNEVMILFEVRESFVDRIRTDSVASVDAVPVIGGLFGGAGLKISIGSRRLSKLPPGSTLEAVNPPDLGELIEMVYDKEASESISAFFHNIQTLVHSLASAEGSFQRTLDNVERISSEASDRKSAVMVALQQGDKIRSILTNAEEVVAKADRTMANLHSLSVTAQTQVQALLIDETPDGKGQTMAQQIRYEVSQIVKLTSDVQTIIDSISNITREIEETTPRLATMLDEVQMQLTETESVLRTLRQSAFFSDSLPDEDEGLAPIDFGGRP